MNAGGDIIFPRALFRSRIKYFSEHIPIIHKQEEE